MGTVANTQCPMCHGHDVDRKWVGANSYLQCNTCGERWKQFMNELILTGISHGKHEFSLDYPKVDEGEICMAHCKCGYEVQINNYWNYGGMKDLQMKWEKHIRIWKGWI